MNTVMMYAMKRSSFLKKRTLPSHAMPITTVSDNDDFIQYLKKTIIILESLSKYFIFTLYCYIDSSLVDSFSVFSLL